MSQFLFEIGCEELPAKNLLTIERALKKLWEQSLDDKQITYDKVNVYTTPRRLAVIIDGIAAKQPDREVERRGPAVSAAFDEQGQPTKAALGFANSCGVDINEISQIEMAKGTFLYHQFHQAGLQTTAILPEIITSILSKLPLGKPMRWSDLNDSFLRPVHWLVALFDHEIVPLNLFAIDSDRITYGHRFLQPQSIALANAGDYLPTLQEQAYVMVDFAKRREEIKRQIHEIADTLSATVMIDEDLLDEVTGLVEWPQALLCHFDREFLQVPAEALISAMHEHQKCFPVFDENKNLMAHFITISNITSRQPDVVIGGNERVMRARLADANFFFTTDKKQSLASRVPALKPITYQAKLGSLWDKTQVISHVANYIGKLCSVEPQAVARAAELAKADLTTDMVGEFPELQGIMGYYYALHDGEPETVANAIKEHYLPRFAGDELPQSDIGQVVALADRFVSLLGIIAVKGLPKGDKDPFALRRAAYGVLRIIVEKQLNLDTEALLKHIQVNGYPQFTISDEAITAVLQFINQRQHAWYKDRQFALDSVNAVLSKNINNIYDVELRIQAMRDFRQTEAALSLAKAHKRVHNILNKQADVASNAQINEQYLVDEPEKRLVAKMLISEQALTPLKASSDYQAMLTVLADLKTEVDDFFDNVMVMAEEADIRQNRLAILQQLNSLLTTVADISQLQG